MNRLLFVLPLLAACTSPRTEVLLLVDNQGLNIPGQIDTVRVLVSDPAETGADAVLYDSQPITLCTTAASGCHTLPFDFTLVPGPKSGHDMVHVEVQALHGGAVVIDDASTFSFTHGKSQRIDFVLTPSCLGTTCSSSDQSCSEGTCTSLAPTPLTGNPDLSADQPTDGGTDGHNINDDLETLPDLNPLTSCGADAGDVNLTSNADNCGACGHVCTDTTGYANTAGVCMASACSVGCETGWGDCDNNLMTNGCEHDVSLDPANCGACGHVCGNTNTVGAMAVCTHDACVFNCSAGTAHCSTSDATGCETTIATDPHNCGSCGFDCGQAACVNGFCRYTATTEQIGPLDALNVLLADATSLYWFNDSGAATGSAVRKVNKDGTGLATVYTTGVGAPSGGNSLAIDQNYAYYFNDTYEGTINKVVKSGAQAPTTVGTTVGASGSGLFLDTDTTANAKYVFQSQTLNGPGLYRFLISDGTRIQVYGAEARGMARHGNTLFFGTLDTNSVRYIDVTAATPSPVSLTTLSGPPRGMDTDGVNVYAASDDGYLNAVSIATGSLTHIATGGPGDVRVATDGANVYVAAGSYIYKVPVNGSGTYASYQYIASSSLPVSANINSVAVDANALYFSTYGDVYKTKK